MGSNKRATGWNCCHFRGPGCDKRLKDGNPALVDVNQKRRSFTEGGASGRTLPPGLTEEEAVELEVELTKVEDEIQTLRHVLSNKERHAGELRRRLGISPLSEIKNNITKGWQDVQSSNAYMKTSQTLGDLNQRITSSNIYLTASATLEDISRSDTYKKTQETLSQAGMLTSSAFSSLGSAIRSRLGEMRFIFISFLFINFFI
ncbi:tumor protein D52-like 2a isoform X3 [Silurus asotus]|uniref:Tumor protein D52-like 2a isoform X3 n=1 Tax=Silurus asotus TaxID=30991 RepID=A0AAD5FFZ9_SILAS|nr:tumor protein D52-like 2a isoform X3 [Silurus asotus]